MTAKGIVRKMDNLGRIVVPIEMRRVLGISSKDDIEIIAEADSIVLRKYEPTCVFCKSSENIARFKSKNICAACLTDLKRG